jgi:hypothetical protein
MSSSTLAGVVPCLVVLGCATSQTIPSEASPNMGLASFSKSSGDSLQGTGGTVVQVDNRTVTGPNIRLYVGEGGIRGTLNFGIPVQITIQGDEAQGVIGSAPFTCTVNTKRDGSAHVSAGTVGVRNTDFDISSTQITGRIAGVVYNMLWTGERYENRVDHGEFTALSLPAVMSTWTNAEVACVLSLVFT